jgi:hypothetical protein
MLGKFGPNQKYNIFLARHLTLKTKLMQQQDMEKR